MLSEEFDREMRCVILEISVGGENGHLISVGLSTDQKIHRRSLNALLAAQIEKSCGFSVIRSLGQKIGETIQDLAELSELGIIPNPREQLLSNNTKHLNILFPDGLA